ncbi:TPA: molybdate ABC transporter permease subunit, partial [Mannheimia haemolytica]|nr:molybdate ABC transporter permease subunit [Mannheimia haemolytica]
MLNFTPQELNAIVLSLKVASIAVVLALPLAVWVAWLLARKQFWGKNLLNGIVHLPLVLPPVVIGYLLLISMAKRGVIGQYLWEWFHFSLSFSWKGAVLASMVMAFPLMVRSIRLAFEAVDPKLEQAARTLGATPLKVFFTLTLPLSFSGIIAGGVLGFARSLGEFGAT